MVFDEHLDGEVEQLLLTPNNLVELKCYCMLFWDGRLFYSSDFDLKLCLCWICFDVWWKSLFELSENLGFVW